MRKLLLPLALLFCALPAQANHAVKVGSFAANTGTGDQVVDTGTGVEGKAVYFWGHKLTGDGNAVHR